MSVAFTDAAPAFILGVSATPVRRQPDRSFTDLVREAYLGALNDAQLADPEPIEGTWFANTLMDFWGQRGMRGQAVLGPLITEGSFPNGQWIVNVESACAGGAVAFNGAWSAVQRGADLALAIGVEKMNDATRPGSELLQWMEGTAHALDPDWYWEPYRRLARDLGVTFDLGDDRSMAMDAYALLALSHMRAYGTTAEHLAYAAAKNHTAAIDNPRAQYRFPMTAEEVLADRPVAGPLTRAMCAPRGDAAAAVLLCSERFLADQPADVRERALLVRGHSIAGGRIGVGWDGNRSSVQAARCTYQMADLAPTDVDVVELHDATAFAEIYLCEDLGLCPRGEGGPFTAAGATRRDGQTAVNPSGGLVARGHPIGATGIVMLNELALQLRGEAREIQVANARIGLAENGGGLLDLDNAVSAVTLLERQA